MRSKNIHFRLKATSRKLNGIQEELTERYVSSQNMAQTSKEVMQQAQELHKQLSSGYKPN